MTKKFAWENVSTGIHDPQISNQIDTAGSVGAAQARAPNSYFHPLPPIFCFAPNIFHKSTPVVLTVLRSAELWLTCWSEWIKRSCA